MTWTCFADSVYCFTPQGDVKTLPNGSTPIDFAYSVHSAVGNKMVGARVNGKLVPIEYRIEMMSIIMASWMKQDEHYMAEINVYANNRTGLLVDISKIFTERKIDIRNINCRTNKQEKATISVSFNVSCKDELNSLIEKIRQLESVLDVERTTG